MEYFMFCAVGFISLAALLIPPLVSRPKKSIWDEPIPFEDKDLKAPEGLRCPPPD